MAEKQIVVAFDLYGTLLSTSSITKQLEQHVGRLAQSIATEWRRYQLEYTWRLNSMGLFESFSDITRNSLLHAVGDHGVTLGEQDVAQLMEAYDSLSTFPDVTPALGRLTSNPNIEAVVFSNGTTSMVANSVLHSKDLSPHVTVFKDIITVDDVKQYKPAPATYVHLAKRMGKQMNEMWLVSGNPFDIVGARSCGMNAIWVDRSNAGWHDAAVPSLQPTAIVNSLEQVVEKIRSQRS